ncbi:MAG: threonine synthase [Gammaproteobacteria bacterium]|nr:threonine synthase [Gammaproteobacteria bacterium]
MNGYRCLACNAEQNVDFAAFVCSDCGGNLDITYDYAAVEPGFGDAEGLFRYRSLLPCVDPGTSLPLTIGGTPLHRVRRLGASAALENLWLKDETGNPSASIKDRASAVALLRAADMGADTVAVASTGNAGSSTACLAAAMGLRAVVFVPETAPPAKLAQSLAYGARVLAVRGSYDDAYDLCMQACEEHGWFNRSTGFNPFTREGKKTVSFELWEQLGQVPDRVIVPTGDGNILSGVWKGWRDLHETGLIDRLPRIDCAQAQGSAAICRAVESIRERGPDPDWRSIDIESVDANTVADSISVDQPRDGLAAVRAVIESGGEAVTISDDEILVAIGELASKTGVFAEPSAAAPWAAAKRLARDGRIDSDETVVLMITGNGLKDVGAVRVGKPERIEKVPEKVPVVTP